MIYNTPEERLQALNENKRLYQCNHCLAVYDDNSEYCPSCDAMHEADSFTQYNLREQEQRRKRMQQ